MNKKLKLDIETLEERIAPCIGGDPSPDVITINVDTERHGNPVTIREVSDDCDPAPTVTVTHP